MSDLARPAGGERKDLGRRIEPVAAVDDEAPGGGDIQRSDVAVAGQGARGAVAASIGEDPLLAASSARA